MDDPKTIIEKAKKVFGPVAETIGAEVLKEFGKGPEFESNYIERLAKIVGNKKLVENIIRGDEK